MSTSEQANFALKYEISPIILNEGLATQLANAGAGASMSILALTEGSSTASFANSQNNYDLSQYFAHFKVLPGGTLQEWQIAEYPFASLQMAANAQIQMPLHVSLMMLCPAQSWNTKQKYNLGFTNKTAKFASIKTQLDAHMALGGTFTVVTPAYTYINALLVKLTDVTSSSDKQVQAAWQWDFVQPLVTQQAALQSFNAQYGKLAGQTPVSNPPETAAVSNVVGTNANNPVPVDLQNNPTGGRP